AVGRHDPGGRPAADRLPDLPAAIRAELHAGRDPLRPTGGDLPTSVGVCRPRLRARRSLGEAGPGARVSRGCTASRTAGWGRAPDGRLSATRPRGPRGAAAAPAA